MSRSFGGKGHGAGGVPAQPGGDEMGACGGGGASVSGPVIGVLSMRE